MSRRRIDVWLFDDLGAQLPRSRDGFVEVGDLEPKHNAMSHWCGIRADQIRMRLLIPGVQLKEQVAARLNAVVDVAMLMVG